MYKEIRFCMKKMKPKLFSHMYKLLSEDLGDVCFLAE